MRAHLTGALAFGRVFNQAAGWRMTIRGRHGDVRGLSAEDHPDLRTSLDKGALHDDLSVEIDLLDVHVSDLASEILAHRPKSVSNRISVWRTSRGDLVAEDIGSMATMAAAAIRRAIFEIRPAHVHLFCATPVEFAVLLGQHLTSTHADLHLYERDGPRYVPSLIVPAGV